MSNSFLAAARIREREVLDNDRPPLATVMNIYQRYIRHFRNAGFPGFVALLPSPVAYGYGRFEFGRRSQAVRDLAYTLGGRGITDAWFHAPRGLIHALNRIKHWIFRARMRLMIRANPDYSELMRRANPASHRAAGAA